jgi:hypothetical protein
VTEGVANCNSANEVSSKGVESRENMHKRKKESITH